MVVEIGQEYCFGVSLVCLELLNFKIICYDFVENHVFCFS